MRRRRNPRIPQFQPIPAPHALRLRREPGVMKRPIQEIAGTIPREHTSRTIGAMRAGSEAENCQTSRRIAARRHGFTPVFLVPVRPPPRRGHLPPMRHKPRAALAAFNLPVENFQAVTIHPMVSQETRTPFRIDGRTALVTGGASGIGEQTSRVLTQAGARVVIVDIDRARADALAAQLPGASVRIFDITDEAAVKAGMEGLEKLDILINNAGIGLVGGVEETEADDFDRIFRVNVRGLYLMTKACLPLLRASRGCIVNIGSVAGLVGVKKRFAYCGTKGAVVAMTRQLAVDYPTEIRVNCIAPGTVDTPFVEGYLEKYHKHEKDQVRAELSKRQPVGRLGKPDEIAYLALYLCSDQAEFVNGAVMPIDGGWTAA